MSVLFAIDTKTEEIIVSDSPKGCNEIKFIERIKREDNEVLYNSVVALTSITKGHNFDVAIFKAMDKVCRMIYNKNK
ncbi:hypothetical protein [Flavobacterium sp.]|uniref:hypothetical protein n=1 Tax=Flavobacterium sp. TaxID=239 RepID=UPI0037C15344